MSPGATERVAIAYDVPASENSFSFVPGSLAAGWSGNITFAIP